MRYIDQSLAPGEVVLARGKWPAVFWAMAWAALILLGPLLVGVFIFLRALIVMTMTDFAVTDRRVLVKRGWLNRRTQEMMVEHIEGVRVKQSIVARLFGYGRVIVAGSGDSDIVFPPMAQPIAFRRAIEAARSNAVSVRTGRIVPDADAETDVLVAEHPAVHVVAPRTERRRSFIGLAAR